MRVRVKSTFACAEGAGATGAIVDVSENLAKQLVDGDAAEYVEAASAAPSGDPVETAAAAEGEDVETATKPKQRGRHGSRSQGAQ